MNKNLIYAGIMILCVAVNIHSFLANPIFIVLCGVLYTGAVYIMFYGYYIQDLNFLRCAPAPERDDKNETEIQKSM